jgi:hypothetical protein
MMMMIKDKKTKLDHRMVVLLLIDKVMGITQPPKDYQEQEKIKAKYS